MAGAPEFTYVLNGEPIDIDAYLTDLVAKMSPLTETQKAHIRALFNVGDEEPERGEQR